MDRAQQQAQQRPQQQLRRFSRDAATATLRRYWNYSAFRDNQLAAIEAVMQGRDVMVVMATGTGKSICYQLPVVMQRDAGVNACVLVVSPLKALMYDQVLGLQSRGILSEVLGPDTPADVELEIRQGQIPIVYITPEKLSSWYDGLEAMGRNSRLLYVAIDESHCVSEWGHDFRPDYRQLHRIRAILPETPIMALTATATERTRADIETHLRLRNVAAFVSSFNRPNLTYSVQPARSGHFDVVKLVADANGPSIVYVLTQQQAEDVARALAASSRRIRAEPYHAGLSDVRRQNTHARFLQGTIDCVVATIAFGMGIDKPDIRLVVHYGLTKSIETYYQQTGRAGRDGLPSKCVMVFSSRDVPVLRSIVTPAPTLHGQLDGIQLMQRYAMLTSSSETPCRRQFLLNHFNEAPPAAPARGCCDLCDERLAPERSATMQVDLGREIFLLLQTVCDTGERFGVKVPVLALRGSSDKRVETARTKGNVRFWGKGRDHSEEWWTALAMQCQVHSLLRSQPTLMNRGSYDRIIVTDEGWRFLHAVVTPEAATFPMTLTDEMLRLYLLENRQAREELAAVAAGAVLTAPSSAAAVAAPAPRAATAAGAAAAPASPPQTTTTSTPAATLIRYLTQPTAQDDERYELRKKLTQLRYQLATQLDRKPYEILSTSGVIALVDQLPRSVDELAAMPGWEITRIERYGQQFIDLVTGAGIDDRSRPSRAQTQPAVRLPPPPPPLMTIGRSHTLDSASRKRSLPFQSSTTSRASRQATNSSGVYKPTYGAQSSGSAAASSAAAESFAVVAAAAAAPAPVSSSRTPDVYRPTYTPLTLTSAAAASPKKQAGGGTSAVQSPITPVKQERGIGGTPPTSAQVKREAVARPALPPTTTPVKQERGIGGTPPTSAQVKQEAAARSALPPATTPTRPTTTSAASITSPVQQSPSRARYSNPVYERRADGGVALPPQQQPQQPPQRPQPSIPSFPLDFDDSDHVLYQPSWSQGRSDDSPPSPLPSPANPVANSEPKPESPTVEIVRPPTPPEPEVIDLTERSRSQNNNKRAFPTSGLCAYPANGAKIKRRP